MSQQLLADAQAHIERGRRIFPLWPGTKLPAIVEWQIKATSDPDIVKRIWSAADYNIGVLCDGMIVLDADVKDGRPGLQSLEALGIDLDTYTVETPTGGRHAYFTGPDVRNSVQSLGPGLDVRGKGGFVVGAGSIIDGKHYRAILGDAPQPAHDGLVAIMARRYEGVKELPDRLVDLDGEEAVALATAYLLDQAPTSVEGQGGDHTAFTVAAFLKDYGISEDMTVHLMLEHWNDRCTPPWEDNDLAVKVHNAFRYGENAPGSKNPAHWFEGIDIEPEPPPAQLDDLIPFEGYDPDNVEDLQDDPWLFYKVAPARGVMCLVGPSGGGKSFLLCTASFCAATGSPFFGVEPDDIGGTAFCFAGSEGSGFKRRMAALCKDKKLPILAAQIGNLRADGAIERLYFSLKAVHDRFVRDFGMPLRMVAIETLSASGLIKDENDSAECSAAIAVLAGLSRRLGVLVIFSHHPPKEKTGLRGSGALLAAVDYVIEVVREPGHRVREVELVKARSAEERQLGSFSLVPVVLGMDSRGRPNETMTVSMGESITPAARKAAHTDKLIEAIEMVMSPEGDADLEETQGMFVALVKGAGNRKNQFKGAYEYAMTMGLFDLIHVDGRPTFRRRVI